MTIEKLAVAFEIVLLKSSPPSINALHIKLNINSWSPIEKYTQYKYIKE